jgi:hypothetical protein
MDNLEQAKATYLNKTLRHLVTNDQCFVKDVIRTDKGVALVMQALKEEAANAKHRLFTAPLDFAKKHFEVEK